MSFKIEHPQRRLALSLAGCFLLLWSFYLATLSPAFPPDDSPETIAAAFSLGIQHPPGYPLAALLGRCAILALPLGGPAFRVNLLSAALACVAALLAGLLAWRLTPSHLQGRESSVVLTALGLGSLAVFWDQATEAKGGFYVLNLALGFGLWNLVVDLSALGWRRGALILGGLSGLMLADHYASAALWILPATAYFAWQARRASQTKVLRWALLALLPGLSLYLYLPLRAAFAPALNWGAPSTWKQFWWMLSRGGYTQTNLAGVEGWAEAQVQLWWGSLWQKGLQWLLPLALTGLWALGTKRRPLALTLGGALLLALYAALVINKTLPEARWLALIFALPATALLAPLAGAGLVFLQGEDRAMSLLGLGLALGLGLWAASANFAAADRSGSLVAWDYAHDLSLSLPAGALYLAEGDYHLMPLLHLQVVDGKRRDVLPVLNVLSGEDWYQSLLLQRDPQLRLPPLGPADKACVELAALNARSRPLRVGPYSAFLTAQSLGVPLEQVGLLRALNVPPGMPDQSLAWAARRPLRQASYLEKVEADLLPWYTVALVQRGNEALARHRPADAISAYRRALDRPGPKPDGPLAYNLGLAYEDAHRKDLAIAAFRQGLRADPGFKPAAERLQLLLTQP
jgi:tetratricopeptide (TPR) repeat protein